MGVNLETVSEAGKRNGTVKSNDEAFEALFAAEYSRVTGIANRVLADSHEAEDVAQEVFIDFNRLHSASAPYAAAWLYRAAAHKALNRVRGRRRRERRELSQATDEGASTMDPQHVLETSEDRRMVRQALARLSTKPATVLVLRASGLSYAEVAQALGVGIGQIGTLLRRAEAALRKEVTRGTSL
ncbi:MAG TPA: sigma-70 family RNA polymerase sigma factor [Candidatus Limnocylindria bacterium]|nr:sigma-70 family RNA polymerase sigma factor [Candidatus Limnocylindria bacterium]